MLEKPALRRAGRTTVEVPGEGVAVLERGRLLTDGELLAPVPEAGPLPRELADELATVLAYLDAKAARLRLVESEGGLAWPLPRLPRYEPAVPST